MFNTILTGEWGTHLQRGICFALLLISMAVTSSPAMANAATVYQHCNYSGYKVNLPAGTYNLRELRGYGVRNDDLSSLRLQPGYMAFIYEHDNFRGRSWKLKSNTACFVEKGLNDVASSVRIVRTKKATSNAVPPPKNNQAVTLYQDCSYGGYAINLSGGNHDLSQLQRKGVRNDDVSGLRVAPGYKAIVYEHAGFRGRSMTFTRDDNCLVDNGFNDKTSSIRVVKNTNTPVARQPTRTSQPAPTPIRLPPPVRQPTRTQTPPSVTRTRPTTLSRTGTSHQNQAVNHPKKQIPVTLGSCKANLYSPQGWNKLSDGSYSPLSRDIKIYPQGVRQAIPIRVQANTSIRRDLSNLRIDASALPIPTEGLFKDLKPQPGALHGPISAGIARGQQIKASAPAHPLDPAKSYLYFQLNAPISINLKGSSGKSRNTGQRKPPKSSVGLSNLVFALDPCDPAISMGGVEVTVKGVVVGLEAMSLSLNGNLNGQSKRKVWTGATKSNGQPQLTKYSQRGHYYQKSYIGLGFGKFLGITGKVTSFYNLDPRRNGALGVTQAAELLQGGAPSPLDYKLMLEGQLDLNLAGLAEMPMQSALVTIDASNPYQTKLKISGKRGPTLSLAQLFPGTPPPGAAMIKASGNIQVYVNANFNSLAGRPNGTYSGKLRGVFTVGPAKVKGDVDLTFRENRPPEVCVKLPGVDRVCGKQIERFINQSVKAVGQAVDNTAQELARFYQNTTPSLSRSFNEAVNTLGSVAADASRNVQTPKANKRDARQLATTAANKLRSNALREVDKLFRTIKPKLKTLSHSARRSYALKELNKFKGLVANSRSSTRKQGANKVSRWSVNPQFGAKYAKAYRKTFDKQLENLNREMDNRMQYQLNQL